MKYMHAHASRAHLKRLTLWIVAPLMTAVLFTFGLFAAGVGTAALQASFLGDFIGGAGRGLSVGGVQIGNVGLDINNGTVSVGIGKGVVSEAPGCGSDNCTKPLDVGQIKFGTKVQTGLRSAILAWINFALGFLALIATAILVVSGLRYVLAGANKDFADQGKKGVEYAVMGIILIFTAYAIVATLIQSGPQGGDISPQPAVGANLLQSQK